VNRSLLTKIANFLDGIAKNEDGKVNRKAAGELAKQTKKLLKPTEVDHNQRATEAAAVETQTNKETE